MGPVRLRHRLPRRLTQLYLGLILYGLSMALIIESALGNMPWDVLHQGAAKQTGLSIGTVAAIVGALVLIAWIPLRERPGIGTISNVIVISVAVDVFLNVLPAPDPLGARIGYAAGGILLNGIATAAYIGAALGPGPRDGLMTGIVRRTGGSVRLVRTSIEIAVVAIGWALGGTLGFSTAAYALLIGPLVQIFLPRLAIAGPET
ncbi:MAG: hypothetical protein H0X18_02230 [Geodermatophilaceae bacterium]|nr:hypothetical protein [Geodermatophilaceae bacterium]